MSETFIDIDSLSHESVKKPGYNIHCFEVMLIFPN